MSLNVSIGIADPIGSRNEFWRLQNVRLRLTDVVALGIVDPDLSDHLQGLRILHEFRHGEFMQAGSQLGQCLDEDPVFGAGRELADERTIDLDDVEGQLTQVIEG
jgi:hypothetical protein